MTVHTPLLWCLYKLLDLVKPVPQSGQKNVFSPVCVGKCCFRNEGLSKPLLQYGQTVSPFPILSTDTMDPACKQHIKKLCFIYHLFILKGLFASLVCNAASFDAYGDYWTEWIWLHKCDTHKASLWYEQVNADSFLNNLEILFHSRDI